MIIEINIDTFDSTFNMSYQCLVLGNSLSDKFWRPLAFSELALAYWTSRIGSQIIPSTIEGVVYVL